MRCARCDAENPAGMRFCGQCGAPLGGGPSPATLPGELKPVTVLFCDLVNSVPMTERLGPEAMRDLVAGFLDAAVGEVRRYGGSVPQFSGDGFMALFGAPVAQEDHVRRALLAALAIRRAFADSQQIGNGRPEQRIRIGVHTGPVVFGAVGGGLGIETAIGDTANLAARLQQAAEPGAILVSEAVWALAQGYARAEPVGPLALKGKSEPIAAYRLVGVSRWRSARDAVLPARLTRFVGRERELALLQGSLEQAETGQGQLVAVVGEPGIGKSRVFAEFRRRSEGERTTWVEGRCLSHGAAIPYQLILDVLRSDCRIGETDSPEAIAQKLYAGLDEAGMDAELDGPVLLQIFGINGAGGIAAAANPEAVRARSFEILQRFVLEGSRKRPLVLLLEDLHWIDAVSEEFLGLLAENVGGAPILLVATCRPEYRPPWADLPNAMEIRPAPLSRDDSLSVVRSVVPKEGLDAPLAEEIVVRADGNPLFLEQLALHAGETRERRSDAAIPQSIHGAVMARIDRLPTAAKRTLQLAAVIGREFSQRLLRAVWEGGDGPEEALHELCRLEFLDEWPDDEGTNYVFRHALTQETAYQSLLERQRRFYHRAVGLALEAAYSARTAEIAEFLAWHFGHSDEGEKAVDYAILAAVKAGRSWANSEALIWFDDALLRLDQLPDTEANRLRRIDAVLKQSEVRYGLGRYPEHIQALEDIRSMVDRAGDPSHQAVWHYWTGLLQSVSGGHPEVAIEHCRKAAKLASTWSLGDINAYAESCLAQVYMVAGRLNDAIAAGESAVSSFEARGNPWWAALTLWHLTAAANYRGDWNASLDYCQRALEHGKDVNDKRLIAVSLSRTGVAHICRGDLEHGLQYCSEALTLAPIPRDVAYARMILGYGQIKSGRLSEGTEQLLEALGWFETSRMRYTQVIGGCWLAEGYLRGNDRRSAQPLIEDLLTTCRTAGYFHYEGRACWLMSECLGLASPSSSEEHVEMALKIFERVGAQNDLARAMVTLAALRQGAGGTGVREILDDARTIFLNLGTLDEPVRVDAALAALESDLAVPLLSAPA